MFRSWLRIAKAGGRARNWCDSFSVLGSGYDRYCRSCGMRSRGSFLRIKRGSGIVGADCFLLAQVTRARDKGAAPVLVLGVGRELNEHDL